jgi:hypothetical protein
MARVIVIVGLMIAITATMFAITRKSTVAPGEAANGPTATVKLDDLPHADPVPLQPPAEPKIDEDQQSLTSVDPRPVVNPIEDPAPAPEAQSAQDVTKGPVAGAAPSIGTAGINDKRRASFTGTATPGTQCRSSGTESRSPRRRRTRPATGRSNSRRRSAKPIMNSMRPRRPKTAV